MKSLLALILLSLCSMAFANYAPTMNGDQRFSGIQNEPLHFKLSGASDRDHDPLSYSLVSSPTKGELQNCLENNSDLECDYIPEKDFHGIVSFSYRAFDGTNSSFNVSKISLKINLPSHIPQVGEDQHISLSENSTINFNLNAGSDLNGDELRYKILSAPTHGTLKNCANGTKSLSCTYIPESHFYGEDSFSYKVNDGTSDSESFATVNISVNKINHPPIMLGGQTLSTNKNTPITFNLNGANDVHGDALNYRLLSPLSSGTLSNCFKGTSCTFTPAPNFTGVVSFSYIANDGELDAESSSTVTILVGRTNSAPTVIADQSFTMNEDGLLEFTLAPATDSDFDLLSYRLISPPNKGILLNCLDILGSLKCTYIPPRYFHGEVEFSYIANDGIQDAPTPTKVSITINHINHPPTMNGDQVFKIKNPGPFEFVAVGASDRDGDKLTYSIVSPLNSGSLQNCIQSSAGLRCIFIPSKNSRGDAFFEYKANDGQVDSVNTSRVTFKMLESPSEQLLAKPICYLLEGNNVHCDSSLSVGEIKTRQWELGNGDVKTESIFDYRYLQNGDYQIKLTVTDSLGRKSSNSTRVTIGSNNIKPEFNVACWHSAPLTISCNAKGSTDSDGSIREILWESEGMKKLGEEIQFVYSSAGEKAASLTLIDNQGLATQVFGTLRVFDFYPPIPLFVCSFENSILHCDASASTTPNGSIVEYRWSFNDEEDVLGSSADYSNVGSGDIFVRLKITDSMGGTSQLEKKFSLNGEAPNPIPNFECAVNELSVSCDASSSSVESGSIDEYKWNFDNEGADTGPTATFYFSNSGMKRITLSVKTDRGVEKSLRKEVLVESPAPVASFLCSVYGNTVSCDASTSYSPEGQIYEYIWNFSDGTSARGIYANHSFSNGGEQLVTLVIRDSFGREASSEQSYQVMYNQAPVVDFSCTAESWKLSCQSHSYDPDGTISSQDFKIRNETIGGETIQYLAHENGNYEVSLTVTDNYNMPTTVIKEYSLFNTPPIANFSCTARSLFLNCDSSGSSDPDGEIFTYTWDFGDSTNGNGSVETHRYAQNGDYEVSLTVTDMFGLSSTTKKLIQIKNEAPTFSFSCHSGSALKIYCSLSEWSDPDGSISKMEWSLDDGTKGEGPSFAHQFAQGGTHEVSFTLTDDIGEKVTKTEGIDVLTHRSPLASFSIDKTSGEPPLEVNYDASSSVVFDGAEIVSYKWDFQSEGTATGIKGSISFGEVKKYQITLTVKDSLGYESSTSKMIGVSHLPHPKFATDKIEGTTPFTVAFSATESTPSEGIIEKYEWDFGDGGKGEGEEISYTYNYPGTYYPTLTLTDSFGAQSSTQTQINVLPGAITFYSRPPEFAISGEKFKYIPDVRTATETMLGFYLQNAPSGMSINQETGEIAWTPTNSTPYKYIFKIIATDGDKTAEQTVILESYVPRVIASQMITSLEGGTITVSGSGTNLDGMSVDIPAGAVSSDQEVSVGIIENSREASVSPKFKIIANETINSRIKIILPIDESHGINVNDLAIELIPSSTDSIDQRKGEDEEERLVRLQKYLLRPNVAENALIFDIWNTSVVMRHLPVTPLFPYTQKCQVGATDALLYIYAQKDVFVANTLCSTLQRIRNDDPEYTLDKPFAIVVASNSILFETGFHKRIYGVFSPMSPETIYLSTDLNIDLQTYKDTLAHEYFHKIQYRKLFPLRKAVYFQKFWKEAIADFYSYKFNGETSTIIKNDFTGVSSILEFTKASLGEALPSMLKYQQSSFFDFLNRTPLSYVEFFKNNAVTMPTNGYFAKQLAPISAYLGGDNQLRDSYFNYLHELLDMSAFSAVSSVKEIRNIVTNGWSLKDRKFTTVGVDTAIQIPPMAGTSYTIDPSFAPDVFSTGKFQLVAKAAKGAILVKGYACTCASGDCGSGDSVGLQYTSCRPLFYSTSILETATLTASLDESEKENFIQGKSHVVINVMNPSMIDKDDAQYSLEVQGDGLSGQIYADRKARIPELSERISYMGKIVMNVPLDFRIHGLPTSFYGKVKWEVEGTSEEKNPSETFEHSFSQVGLHSVNAKILSPKGILMQELKYAVEVVADETLNLVAEGAPDYSWKDNATQSFICTNCAPAIWQYSYGCEQYSGEFTVYASALVPTLALVVDKVCKIEDQYGRIGSTTASFDFSESTKLLVGIHCAGYYPPRGQYYYYAAPESYIKSCSTEDDCQWPLEAHFKPAPFTVSISVVDIWGRSYSDSCSFAHEN